jgi:hypothetical protein
VGEPGRCPDGYELLPISPAGVAPDLNGNGYYCLGAADKIDDIISGNTQKANAGGHGNFSEKGKLGLQDLSFSFRGLGIDQTSDAAKGEFEFHDQNNGLNVHGDVTCLVVMGNQIIAGGVVEQSDDAGLPVGSEVIWFAEDNGEGSNAAPDRVTRPMPGVRKGQCSGFKFVSGAEIEGGNFQVK